MGGVRPMLCTKNPPAKPGAIVSVHDALAPGFAGGLTTMARPLPRCHVALTRQGFEEPIDVGFVVIGVGRQAELAAAGT